MRNFFRRAVSYPLLSVGSTVLWGLIEFIALQGSRHTGRENHSLLKR